MRACVCVCVDRVAERESCSKHPHFLKAPLAVRFTLPEMNGSRKRSSKRSQPCVLCFPIRARATTIHFAPGPSIRCQSKSRVTVVTTTVLMMERSTIARLVEKFFTRIGDLQVSTIVNEWAVDLTAWVLHTCEMCIVDGVKEGVS